MNQLATKKIMPGSINYQSIHCSPLAIELFSSLFSLFSQTLDIKATAEAKTTKAIPRDTKIVFSPVTIYNYSIPTTYTRHFDISNGPPTV